MIRRLWNFGREESGAVSVDWVTLSAVVIGLAIASVGVAKSGVIELGGRMMDDVSVP